MRKKIIGICLVGFLQIAFLAFLIYKHEHVLYSGGVFLLKTKPVDPYDPLRGRYARLSFDIESIDDDLIDFDINYGDDFYIELKNKDGFGFVASTSKEKPSNKHYLKVKYKFKYKNKHLIKLDFDKFFVQEDLARDIEKVLRDTNNTYTSVRVLDGLGVIDGLYVGKTPIAQYIKTKR